MKVKVLVASSVNNEPREVGDVAEVSADTARNLVAKGRVEIVDANEGPVETPETPVAGKKKKTE